MKAPTDFRFAVCVASMVAAAFFCACREAVARPNVLLIVTDDQGYGDVGIHGNDKVRTPTVDRLAAEGLEMTRFYAMPVCTPTRACLMTGRYHFRTRAIDTIAGRAMMDPGEVTVAEVFRDAGYRTAFFGKWHLGDNYPMRAMDQGFERCVNHRGGGIADTSDFPGNRYTDPVLLRDGKPERFRGYCTDIFTDEAIRFLDEHGREPFLVYFATNVPHDPLQPPGEEYVRAFEGKGLTRENEIVYAMLKNLDDNVARLLKKLDELGVADDTVVIFMSDNGPAMRLSEHDVRFNAGLRGEKKQVYEGGVRVPFFVRWPAKVRAGEKTDRVAHAIDLLPTLCAACGVATPDAVKIDGRSLLPLWEGEGAGWPERTVHLQWQRGDEPVKWDNCASLDQRFKLVNGRELYDVGADPTEERDVAARHPEVVARLRGEYEAWFAGVCSTRDFRPPAIGIGNDRENPTVLSPQDWRGATKAAERVLGGWNVRVESAGRYALTVQCYPGHGAGDRLRVALDDRELAAIELAAGRDDYEIEGVRMDRGTGVFRVTVGPVNGESRVVRQVTLRRER